MNMNQTEIVNGKKKTKNEINKLDLFLKTKNEFANFTLKN